MAKRQVISKTIGPKEKFSSFWVMINLNGPRYWKVSNGIIEKSSAPASNQGPVISFDDTSDYRVKYDKNGSLTNAKKYFLTEQQEKCRVFSGKKGIYYGTPVGRIEQFEHILYPGSFYIDQLVEKQKTAFDQDKIIGFKFESTDENNFSIIVLFSLTTSGEMSQPEIALNPPDLQLVIRDYAQQHGVTDTEPVLFGIDDLINNVVVGSGYPTEDMVGSLSVNTIEKICAVTITAGLMLSLSASGMQYWLTNNNINNNIQAQKKVDDKKKATEVLIKENLHAFSRLTSINTTAFTTYSELLWNNYSLVTSAKADRENGVLRARIPVEILEASGSGGNIIKLSKYNDIKTNLDRTFTDGLSRGKLTISADNNAYEIEYNFKTLDNNFNSLVGRK